MILLSSAQTRTPSGTVSPPDGSAIPLLTDLFSLYILYTKIRVGCRTAEIIPLEPDLDYASVGKRNKGLASIQEAVPSLGDGPLCFVLHNLRFFGILSLSGVLQRR